MNNKKAQREAIKQKQKGLSERYILDSNRKICKNILALKEFKNASIIFCFVGRADEIDTVPIFNQAWKDGKEVVVPKCIRKGVMEAYKIDSFQDLEPGKFGILEPKAACTLVKPETIDFAIIPCMSCNLKGERLGYGGGYYDRYLENADFPTAVICRDALLLKEVATELHDLAMDIVVTESGIFR